MSRTNHIRPPKNMHAAINALCSSSSRESRLDRRAWGRKSKPAERAALADLRDELHHEAHTWSLVAAVKRLVRVRAATLRALCGGP